MYGHADCGTASQADTAQVKVWLGSDQGHYYVLSRFLVSRMLTVTKLPALKAVKIALELKKALVDSERLNLTQVSRLGCLARIATQPCVRSDDVPPHLAPNCWADFDSEPMNLMHWALGT